MNNLQRVRAYTVVLVLLMASITYARATDQPAVTLQNNLLLRKIGHQFLRANGDSSSRVLSVDNLASGGFSLRFEK